MYVAVRSFLAAHMISMQVHVRVSGVEMVVQPGAMGIPLIQEEDGGAQTHASCQQVSLKRERDDEEWLDSCGFISRASLESAESKMAERKEEQVGRLNFLLGLVLASRDHGSARQRLLETKVSLQED